MIVNIDCQLERIWDHLAYKPTVYMTVEMGRLSLERLQFGASVKKTASWAYPSIPPFPGCGYNLTSHSKFLPLWLPHRNGRHPQTVSRDKPFLPYIAFVGHFIIATDRNQYTRFKKRGRAKQNKNSPDQQWSYRVLETIFLCALATKAWG